MPCAPNTCDGSSRHHYIKSQDPAQLEKRDHLSERQICTRNGEKCGAGVGGLGVGGTRGEGAYRTQSLRTSLTQPVWSGSLREQLLEVGFQNINEAGKKKQRSILTELNTPIFPLFLHTARLSDSSTFIDVGSAWADDCSGWFRIPQPLEVGSSCKAKAKYEFTNSVATAHQELSSFFF
jgi:hypothetical protein